MRPQERSAYPATLSRVVLRSTAKDLPMRSMRCSPLRQAYADVRDGGFRRLARYDLRLCQLPQRLAAVRDDPRTWGSRWRRASHAPRDDAADERRQGHALVHEGCRLGGDSRCVLPVTRSATSSLAAEQRSFMPAR